MSDKLDFFYWYHCILYLCLVTLNFVFMFGPQTWCSELNLGTDIRYQTGLSIYPQKSKIQPQQKQNDTKNFPDHFFHLASPTWQRWSYSQCGPALWNITLASVCCLWTGQLANQQTCQGHNKKCAAYGWTITQYQNNMALGESKPDYANSPSLCLFFYNPIYLIFVKQIHL